jgi:hypothetical protein
LDLTQVTLRLADFLLPPAIAALQGIAFSRFWQASVGWVEK